MKQENTAHFDYQELLNRHDNNIEMIEKVIPIAKQSLWDSLDLLEQYMISQDEIGLKQTAHRLKGTARSLCLPNLIEYSSLLETYNFQNGILIADQVRQIRSEIKKIFKIFESLSKG